MERFPPMRAWRGDERPERSSRTEIRTSCEMSIRSVAVATASVALVMQVMTVSRVLRRIKTPIEASAEGAWDVRMGGMDAIEHLERELTMAKAHAEALRVAHEETSRKYVQAQAQLTVIRGAAEKRIREAAEVIDLQAARIDAMCDAWLAQIATRKDIDDETKARLIAEVEPFRPQRIGEAVVDESGDHKS